MLIKLMHALKIMPFCFFSQLLQSQRSCPLYPISPALYIQKMHPIPSTLFQRSVKLFTAKALSHTENGAAAVPPSVISGITKGLSPLKPTSVSHLRPLTAQPIFVRMKTSLP